MLIFQKPIEKENEICYNIQSRTKRHILNKRSQSCAVKQGQTSRGFSGALYLKSATAGVDPAIEGGIFTNWVLSSVLRGGSCAIGSCEPCQMGDQAALSGKPDVPRGCLPWAEGMKIAWGRSSTLRCLVLFHAHDIFWSASFGETEKAERKEDKQR